MTATVHCGECGRKLRVPEERLGSTFSCPGCQTRIRTKKPVEPAATPRSAGPSPTATRLIIFGAVGTAATIVTALTIFLLMRSSESAAAPEKKKDKENLAAGELVDPNGVAPFGQPAAPQPAAPQPAPQAVAPQQGQQPPGGFAPVNRQPPGERNPAVVGAANQPPGKVAPVKELKDWELADFQKALDERNAEFVAAVGTFGQRKKGDDKNADELNALLAAAGNLPDEANPGFIPTPRTTSSVRRRSRGSSGVTIRRVYRNGREIDLSTFGRSPGFDPAGFRSSSMSDINRARSAAAANRLKSLGSSRTRRSTTIRRRR